MAVFSVDSDAVLATTAAVRGTIDRLQGETQRDARSAHAAAGVVDRQRRRRLPGRGRPVARDPAPGRGLARRHQRRARRRRTASTPMPSTATIEPVPLTPAPADAERPLPKEGPLLGAQSYGLSGLRSPCHPSGRRPERLTFSGLSATTASVVRNRPAIDAAFCSAERVTFAGSMMPCASRSPYSPVAALRP